MIVNHGGNNKKKNIVLTSDIFVFSVFVFYFLKY